MTVVTAERKGVWAVPYDALVTDAQGQTAVYVARPQGEEGGMVAVAVPVDTGLETDFYVEISSGQLAEGDLLLLRTPSRCPSRCNHEGKSEPSGWIQHALLTPSGSQQSLGAVPYRIRLPTCAFGLQIGRSSPWTSNVPKIENSASTSQCSCFRPKLDTVNSSNQNTRITSVFQPFP